MFPSVKNKLVVLCSALLLSGTLFMSGCGDTVDSADGSATPDNPPSVTTLDATDITETSVRLNGKVTGLGDSESANVSFEIALVPGNYLSETPVQTVTDKGEFVYDLNGFYAYMTYYYRAKISGDTEAYGEEKSFTILPEFVIDPEKTYTATMKTNYGDIVLDLFPEEAPLAVNNFVVLSRQGYYNNVPFHRIVAGFMAQSGDPTGTGSGGPGYQFIDEPVTREYVEGTLAMANRGANTNGSQFFITLADVSTSLPKNYTIFGLVKEGLDVLHEIGNVPVTDNGYGEKSKPTVDVYIESIVIEES